MTGSSATPGLWSQGHVSGKVPSAEEVRRVLAGLYAAEEKNIYGENGRFVAMYARPEDAKLGAAAPELLEAVYAALPFVEDALNDPAYKAGAVKKYLDQMRGAIAKAEGK